MVLSIDLGTTNVKSMVFGDRMEILSQASAECPLITLPRGEVEQDACDWWNRVRQTVKAALGAPEADSRAIDAIAVSSQGITLLPVGRDGKALCPAISWMDTRAVEEEEELIRRFGKAELYRRTGKRASRIYTLPKLMRLKRRRPDIYEAAWKFMLPLDYLGFKLCGESVTDHSMASGTMLYDIRERGWARDMMLTLGLEAEKLSRVADAGTTVGRILPELAEEMSMRSDVRIVLGGQDQKCAALGAGLDGQTAAVSLGTGCCVSALCASPVADEKGRIPCFSYLSPASWVMEGVMSTGAACYRWFRDNFARGLNFEKLDELAAKAKPGREIFYPYLSGSASPHWSEAQGGFIRLTLDSSTGSLARAVLEGVAYGIRENLETMSELGARPSRLAVFGGGAKSPLWPQIIADVTGLPVVGLSSAQTALAGAAMLALRACGETEIHPLPVEASYTPNPALSAVYEAGYRDYLLARRGLETGG